MYEDQEAAGIAVIGMACRFPGARNVEQFWSNLRGGVESVVRFSEQELLESGIDPHWLGQPRYVPVGGPIEGVEEFDAELFGMTAREAAMMDPQHRLLLECAWEALESAAYRPTGLDGSVGVYAGSRMSEYLLFRQGPPDLVGLTRSSPINGFQSLISNDKDYLATRISFALDLQGPAMAVQTACSTSLVAVHLACQALLDHECDIALAGGASVRVPQRAGYVYSEGMIFSPDGHTRTFDARAGGTVFSSGAGFVALRRLEDALANGDPIWAVVRGSAVNNDGAARKSAYTAPSQVGQARVISEAMSVAGVDARSIGCLEAHGTATALGDPIEIAALTEVFRAETEDVGFCSIGSVKTNIGHTVQAAGVAGLIKAVLQLRHRELVPTLNFDEPNPEIDFQASPFRVQAEAAPWRNGDGPRRAGVSSFGVGGTNAHVVLEEAPRDGDLEPAVPRTGHVVVLSAGTGAAADAWAGRFAEHLERHDVPLDAVCRSAGRRLGDMRHTLAVAAPDRRRMIDRLAAAAAGKDGAGIVRGERPDGGPTPQVAFLFPGQGSQFPGMGRELYRSEPVFRDAVDRCAALFDPELDRSLATILFDDGGELLGETLYTQPALFSVEVAATELWRSWGVEPAFVAGHSLGEVGAAWAAGVLSLEDAARLVVERARWMQDLPADGAMAVVFTDEARARAALDEAGGGAVGVAAVNGPASVVLSGASDALRAVLDRLAAEGVGGRPLDVARAFHSPVADRSLEPLERIASGLEHLPARVPWISNVTGEAVRAGESVDGRYWARHLRSPVRFADGLERLAGLGATVFLEVGPGTALATMGRRHPAVGEALWLPTLRQGTAHRGQTFDSLGRLAVAGVGVDWRGVDREARGKHVPLPTYPFQRRRHWIDERGGPRAGAVAAGGERALSMLGDRRLSPIAESQYEAVFDADTPRFMRDHQVHGEVVFPAVGFLEMVLAAASETFGTERPSASQLTIREALLLPEDRKQVVHSVVTGNGSGARVRIYSRPLDARSDDWRLIVEAALGEGEAASESPAIEELRRRCPDELPTEEFYRRWRAEGVEHGESFRGIETLWTGPGEALGRIRAHPVVAESNGSFLFHPALMSACLQVAEAVSKAQDEAQSEGVVYLPVIWERVVAHGRGSDLVWSHATLRAGEPGGEIRTVDLRVLDDRGRLLLEVDGLHFKRASRDALRGGAQADGLDDWLYGVEWRDVERPAAQAEAPHGRWLLFGDPEGTEARLRERLEARGDRVVVVEPGDRFDRPGADRFRVRSASREDFERLLGTLRSEDAMPDAGIIHLWSLRAPGGDRLETADLIAAQRELCGGLLHFLQAYEGARDASAGPGVPLPLVLVTRGAQPVQGDAGGAAVTQATVWGLGRVIGQEHAGLRCRLIDLDPEGPDPAEGEAGPSDEEASRILSEIADGGPELEVGLRGAETRVPRLVRAPAALSRAGSRRLDPPPRYRLGISERGALENLTLDPIERREPGPGEVEIEVAAASLN
ncbi:MAG: beta-ketoacyl synthase N-terminal-like domain-containing protein, partial [Acidobacteriota bacterium]